jgi:hypothetical protein
MADKDVIKLAKGNKTTILKKRAARKPAAKKPVDPKLTAEQERDLKAKETVEKLLEDSPIVTLDKKEELLQLDEEETPKGVEWLEEQVTLLGEKNKALSAELEVVKIENQQLRSSVGTSDGDVKAGVVQIFNELQTNYINRGLNSNTGEPNFVIYPVGFMNRLIKFFPFLAEMKRF